jgi:hypothetical protein
MAQARLLAFPVDVLHVGGPCEWEASQVQKGKKKKKRKEKTANKTQTRAWDGTGPMHLQWTCAFGCLVRGW